ncbi:MAG: tetratricopeptide repeat protein [Myxococcales bacterium]|nr:tetratricopeptide repeat protein [Myxococcales bacterium]
MKERIQSLISQLEHDPSQEEPFEMLEEIATEEWPPEETESIRAELSAGQQRLISAGRIPAAIRLTDIELALAQGPEQETRIMREKARLLDEELFAQEEALEVLKKAALLTPDDPEINDRIELITAERARWKEIVAKFKEQAEAATDMSLRAHMLYSAAERCYKNDHESPEQITELLQAAMSADPTHHKAARLLERLYEDAANWSELVALYTSLAQKRPGRADKVQMLLAAAYTTGHHLDDMDAAAALYAEVLDYQPGHPSALRFLVKYYESREDWDHLVAVYEDTLHGKLLPEDEMAALTQAGMIHWKFRDDMDAADTYFKRLRRMAPAHPGMLSFYRTWLAQSGDNGQLLKILNDALRATESDTERDALNREIAQIAAADGGNIEKAIDAWKKVLRQEPTSEEARTELKKLYRQSEKWNNLADLLKTEVESIPDDDVAAKVAIYEEMVEIYRDGLNQELMVIKIYDAILRIDPANESVLESMTATYESAGRWSDLINTLMKRAEVAESPEQKVAHLHRAASLWIERFNNFNKAVDPLEEILKISPDDRDAIEMLKAVYERRRAWRPLLELHHKELALLEGAAQLPILTGMATLAEERLGDIDAAIALWHQILPLETDSDNALQQLERLNERQKNWTGLAEIIEMRLERTDDNSDKVALLTKLGTIYKDRIKEPAQSADAWSRLLKVEPGNTKAMRSLKEAYQAADDWDSLETLFTEAGDFESLVEVLGIAADKATDPETKIMLSFKCADLYNNQIGHPDRALRHYERVLSVDEQNLDAAKALVPIYQRSEKWSRLIKSLEIVLDATEDPEERALRMDELRDLAISKLNNRALAYTWAARAYAEIPTDADIRATVEQAAEDAHAWDDLIALYKDNIQRLPKGERTEMERHIAALSLDKLGAVDDAVKRYRKILKKHPADEAALLALDNIYRTTARWDDLIGIYNTRIENASDLTARRALMLELANLYETGMDDTVRAAVALREILDMSPRDAEAIEALERIFRAAEQWTELAQIVEEKRLGHDAESDEWFATSYQLAEILGEKVGNRIGTLKIYSEVLDARPCDEQAVAALEPYLRDETNQLMTAQILEPHLAEMEDWKRLAWVLTILLENAPTGPEKLALHMRLADIYAQQMNDERAAFETLGAALKETPDNVSLWDSMAAIATSRGYYAELAQALSDTYKNDSLDDSLRLELAHRLTALYDHDLVQPQKAETYHRLILSETPDAVTSFNALENLYTDTENWRSLLGLYQEARDRESYSGGHLELLKKICFIVYEIDKDVPAAIAAYRDVIALEPEDAEANRALAELYEESGDWSELSNLLLNQLQHSADVDEISLRYRIGEITDKHLQSPEDAIEYYEQVIDADPDHLKAQSALEGLLPNPALRLRAARVLSRNYEHQGAAEPLANTLMITLEDDELSTPERVDILIRVADLRERRLANPMGAFEALSEALAADPDNEFLFSELSRMADEHHLVDSYCQFLETQITAVKDDAIRARFMAAVAHRYDTDLADMPKARAAYQRLFDLDPTNPNTALEAVDALDRLLTADESWEDLLAILRARVDLLDDSMDQRDVLHRMSEIEETILERPDNAIAIFREITDIDDVDIRALSGLERLYSRLENWPELIDILQKRAEVESDAEMRKDILLRVATLQEERMSNIEKSIEAYAQILEEIGPSTSALTALQRLYTQTERWTYLHEVLESQLTLLEDPNERADKLFELGSLLTTHLNAPEEAANHFGEAIALTVDHPASRQALESLLDSPARLTAIEILNPLAEAEADYEKMLKYILLRADEADDPQEKSMLFAQAAQIAETGLDSPERAFALSSKAFRNGTASPDIEDLIQNLERLAPTVDAYDELSQLYREAGADILDSTIQNRIFLRVATIAHRIQDDAERAREYYLKILDIDADNLEAMDALEEIYQAQEQHLELFEVYRMKIQSTFDDDVRKATLFKSAKLCEEKLEDISSATQTYESILELEDTNAEAIASLERLYPRSERWGDLLILLERRMDNEPHNRVALLHQLGELSHERLGDDERALDYFQQVLETDSAYAPTIATLEACMKEEALAGRVAEMLEPVYAQRGNWDKLASALQARLQVTDDPMDRKELLRRLGTLYEEQLGNLDQAFETFALMFHEDAEDRTSWDLITRLGGVLENWERQTEVLAHALENALGDTPETAELAFMLGALYENRLKDPARAKDAYHRTLSFAPDDDKAFDAVERMLLATKSWADLLALYRDATDASSDIERQKSYLFRMADIHERVHNDRDAAIEIFREVLTNDDRDETAINALDRLYFQSGRFDDLVDHLRDQSHQAETEVSRNALRRQVARIQEENLTDLPAALDTYEEALTEVGGDPRSVAELERLILNEEVRERIADILEPIYREQDEWKKLVVILQTQVDFRDSAADKVDKFTEISQLHEERGQNYLLAFAALSQAFVLDPSRDDILQNLERLTAGIENYDELAATLESALPEVFDAEHKKELYRKLGNITDQHLENPRRAIESYRHVLEIDAADANALDALESLYNLVADWDGLVEILGEKAQNAVDPEVQSALLCAKASIHDELMAAPNDAIQAYAAALEALPTSLEAITALERLYAEASKWPDYIDVRRQRLDLTEDSDARKDIYLSMGQVFAEHIKDNFEAIDSYRNVLDIEPENRAAIQALDTLYTAESNYADLLDNLQLQRTLAQDQFSWVELTLRIATLQKQELSDLEGAVQTFNDVLTQHPTNAEAIQALETLAKDESVRALAIDILEPLHREAGRYDHLASLLELRLETLSDPSSRIQELIGLAEIHEAGRSDPRNAFDTWLRALTEDPSRVDTLDQLERIASAEGLFAELTGALETHLPDIYDQEAEREALLRIGRIKEAHLKDDKGATEAYRQVLDNGDTSPEVLNALDRLYTRQHQWRELDEILDIEIQNASDVAEQCRLKYRQGHTREHEFGEVESALNVYREILEIAPDHADATAALEALLSQDAWANDAADILQPAYEQCGELHKITRLFETRLRIAADPHDKIHLYRELAMHQENALQDPTSAFDAYANAFRLHPAEDGLIEELERLANITGSWEALVNLAEKAVSQSDIAPSEKVSLGLKIAGWAASQVGNPRMAESLYRKVLDSDPDHREALDALATLLTDLGRFEDLLPVLRHQADVAYDFEAKKALLQRAAQIAIAELSQTKTAMACYRAILALDESDIDTIDALITLTEGDAEPDYAALADLLIARAQFTSDTEAASQFRHRAATLCAGPLDDLKRAVDIYQELLDMDPGDRNAIAQLENAFERLEDWTELNEVYLRKLDMASEIADRNAVLHQLSALAEKRFDDPDAAINHLSEIAVADPDDKRAIAELPRLMAQVERWSDLAEFYEDRANRAAMSGDVDEELTHLVRLGELAMDHLGDSVRATEMYERVLERDPEHTRALSALARLYEADGDWDRVADILRRAAATSRGGEDAAEVHYQLARLNEQRLDNPEEALAELKKAVAFFPGHIAANRALADISRRNEDYPELVAAIEREEAVTTDTAQKTALLLELSGLYAEKCANPAGAVSALEKAYALDQSNKDLLLQLSDAYIAANRNEDAIPVIESLIDAETEGGKRRTKTAAIYHGRLARAFNASGFRDKAKEHLELAYKMDISNVENLVDLGRFHYESGDLDAAAKLFRALLLQKFDKVAGLTKADIYCYVGEIQLQQGEPRKAKGMFQRGLDEDRDHEGCKAGLARC